MTNRLLLLLTTLLFALPCGAQPPAAVGEGPTRINPALRAEKVDDPLLKDFPIAPGWPLALPGAITSTPVVADLDGDGEGEIIVTCMQSLLPHAALVNTQPSTDAQLWAFYLNGKVCKNWPLVLVSTEERKQAKVTDPNNYDYWYSSPSVLPLLNGDNVVVNFPNEGDWRRRVRRIFPKGASLLLSFHSDPWASAPIVDINGDGEMDVVEGRVACTINGEPIPGWPEERKIPGGWAPAIGDANGDGHLEVYHPDYGMGYHEKPPKPQHWVIAYDRTGQTLPGWPQKVAGNAMYVVMGDVNGDDKMEICAQDSRGQIHLWTWDGKPAAATTEVGEFQTVFKSGLPVSVVPLTLADLDGDGKAEIIRFDSRSSALTAWRGDGKGLFNETGVVCVSPGARGMPGIGVTVADLGGDGVMDLFCAQYWVKLAKDGTTALTRLLPAGNVPTAIASHVTICDPEGDGLADLLFGTSDGRVFLYQTGLAYKPEWLQWPTQSGNFQHTGVWRMKN